MVRAHKFCTVNNLRAIKRNPIKSGLRQVAIASIAAGALLRPWLLLLLAIIVMCFIRHFHRRLNYFLRRYVFILFHLYYCEEEYKTQITFVTGHAVNIYTPFR